MASFAFLALIRTRSTNLQPDIYQQSQPPIHPGDRYVGRFTDLVDDIETYSLKTENRLPRIDGLYLLSKAVTIAGIRALAR
jgi:hypothetical protein